MGNFRVSTLLSWEFWSNCSNVFPSSGLCSCSFCCDVSYISQLIHLSEWRSMQKMPQVLWHHLLEIFIPIEQWVNALLLYLLFDCRYSEGIFSCYLWCCFPTVSFLMFWPFLFCELCCLLTKGTFSDLICTCAKSLEFQIIKEPILSWDDLSGSFTSFFWVSGSLWFYH